MPHISKLPITELLTDMCAASYEMGIAKVGLEIAKGWDKKTTTDFQKRYDGNEKQVKTIQNEILRRLL